MRTALVGWLMVLLGACGGGDTYQISAPPLHPAQLETSVEPSTQTSAPTSQGVGAKPSSSHVVPVAMRIPAIKLNSRSISKESWEPLGLNKDRSLATSPISNPTRFGWYCPLGVAKGCGAPYPGAVGPAVISGHVNGDGRAGALYSLAKANGSNQIVFNVHAGDLIDVDLSNGSTQMFKVSRTEAADKEQFPAASVFGYVDHPALRLITCGGVFDQRAHNYLSNVIVFADWVRSVK